MLNIIHISEEQSKALGPIATGVAITPHFLIYIFTLNKPEFCNEVQAERSSNLTISCVHSYQYNVVSALKYLYLPAGGMNSRHSLRLN